MCLHIEWCFVALGCEIFLRGLGGIFYARRDFHFQVVEALRGPWLKGFVSGCECSYSALVPRTLLQRCG